MNRSFIRRNHQRKDKIMFQKTSATIIATLAVASLFASLAPTATAQTEERTQTLYVTYPGTGVILSGKGKDAVTYRGTVHVEVFPISSKLKAKQEEGPVAIEDITSVGSRLDLKLPVGQYEVHFSMREGDELRTTIKPVILRADGASAVEVDFSPAKTLIYGGDMTARQMADSIRQLQKEVANLKK
jgi:hypothetical protein